MLLELKEIEMSLFFGIKRENAVCPPDLWLVIDCASWGEHNGIFCSHFESVI